MVTGLHNWDFELLRPDLGRPISNGKEIFEMDRVSVHRVDRSMMLSRLVSPSALNFSLFVSVLAHDSVSLLGAH